MPTNVWSGKPTPPCTPPRGSGADANSSSRPKECSTLALVVPAVGSQTLCTSCRYRTGTPALFRRVDARTNTSPDAAHRFSQLVDVRITCSVPGDPAPDRGTSPSDLGKRQLPSPEPALTCGTRGQLSTPVVRMGLDVATCLGAAGSNPCSGRVAPPRRMKR